MILRLSPARLAGLLVAAMLPCAALAAPSEYELKAAFLVNVQRFVDWPEGDPAIADIVVVEPDPFGRILDRDANGASLPHALKVERNAAGQPAPAARVLFAGKSSGVAGLDAMASAPRSTLTIGETEEFIARGGIVWLAIVDKRLHIEINVDAAARSGLHISSRLLQIATRRHESEMR